VLGTAFNVRSYKNEKITETSLFRGSVEITTHNNPDRKIMLRPNEKLVIQNVPAQARTKNPADDGNPDEMPVMTLLKLHFQKKDSTAAEILWMKNKLSFDGESLENVALKIERWYDVKVNITSNKLKTVKYTAVFENESLPEVMEALRLTGNFTYTVSNKEVTIY
jgi:transmembrane sensor